MPVSDFSSSPLIDKEQFEMLVSTGEDDAVNMINELLGLFTGEVEPKFIDMQKAAVEMDRYKFTRMAHALAGASANLGCLRLSQVCRAYEHGSKTDLTRDELVEGAKAIEALYRISIEAMQAEITKIGK
jgi:HPt (histidine-containing phosphotransfer) domain-containing protein